MSEYIEREALMEELAAIQSATYMSTCLTEDECKGKRRMIARAIDAVKDAPAADVAPVVHGEWVEAKLNGMSLYPVGQKMCSVCGQIMPSRWETMPPFCYGCGAKMNRESEVEND